MVSTVFRDTLSQLPFHENRDTRTPHTLENKKKKIITAPKKSPEEYFSLELSAT